MNDTATAAKPEPRYPTYRVAKPFAEQIEIGFEFFCDYREQISSRIWHRFLVVFWSQVYACENDGCWIWVGNLSPGGYGSYVLFGEVWVAHRVSYSLFKGPIPAGLEPDHLCRNRCCINPKHLEAVTRRVNLLRGNTYPAKNVLKEKCPAGHSYTQINTYWEGTSRHCRRCRREQGMRWRAAHPKGKS